MRAGMSVVISLNVVAAALIPGSFSSLRDSAGGRRGFRLRAGTWSDQLSTSSRVDARCVVIRSAR